MDENIKEFKKIDIFLTTIFTILFIVQIILIFIYNTELDILWLFYLGYVFWAFSIYLGFIPFRIFKKEGDVKKGESYIHTNKIVKKGPYSIIRHPQYLGGVFLTISVTLWTQVWISLLITIALIILTYQWTYREEITLISKFGEDYIQYQNEVTRLNPIYGIYKYLKNRR